MKILHIEHDANRRTLVCQALKEFALTQKEELVDVKSTVVKTYLDGAGKGVRAGCQSWEPSFGWLVESISGFDLVFLHTSNKFGAGFLKYFVELRALDPERVVLYSGEPQSDWPRPNGCASPVHIDDMVEWASALAVRWSEGMASGASQAVADVLASIHEVAIWRQRWFATALLATLPDCPSEQIAGVFKDVKGTGDSLDDFLKTAFWRQRDRLTSKLDFLLNGNPTPLWRTICHDKSSSPLNEEDLASVRQAALNIIETICK